MRPQILYSNLEVAAWVFSHLPRCSQNLAAIRRDTFWAVGFTRCGKLCGGVAYYNLIPNVTIEMAIYGTSPFVDRRIGLFIEFVPFEVFHVKHVTCFVRHDNNRCIGLLRRGKWRLEGVQRYAFDGVYDCLVFGLTRADAEWAHKILMG